ncbi:CGNR zinc finger domain-containing protein [Lentzea alba]|uniref:CGNR zinc finger domain-containing protein n=1 Tax=Lentzea alba TaxID=2714351 RepID=UPI0039BF41E4
MTEGLLLDLLNTTPVIDGVPRDELGLEWLAAHDQHVSEDELRALVSARDALQAVVRGGEPSSLAPFVEGVRQVAGVDSAGVTWHLDLPAGRSAAARAVLAWDALRVSSPGRLRPCANDECRLFLIDHSKPNSARWCSMAVCGNRMKARRHYQRTRGGQ